MIYGGDGLARLPPDASGRGKAVFIPFVLAAEEVEATLAEQKPGFVRAHAKRIVEPSPYRVEAGCPYFGQCGGCQYQHAAYEHQLQIKKGIFRETLRRTAKMDLALEIQVHPSPPWNYRNRSRLQVQTNPSFALGYFKMGSHELLPVEICPISSPLINRGIAALWHSGRAAKVPPGIQEVEFFANADDSKLLLEVSASADARRASVREWAEEMRGAMAEISGVVVFRQTGSRGVLNEERWITVGDDHLLYRTQKADYRVSAGSFFQTNRFLVDELVRIVATGQSGERALDLYSGVGLFSTALAGDFHHIVSVESSQTSSADLAYNRPANVEVAQATAEQYFAGPANKRRSGKGAALRDLQTPDLAVVDPPRTGLGDRVARSLAKLAAPRVIYVSCDPATLARDLVVFAAAGYRLNQVHLVDLFPQTFHLETVVHLVR